MPDIAKIKLDDATFDSFLPNQIKEKSFRFFTSASVAIKVAKWLSGDDKRTILDIGAGTGKFCIFAAKYTKSKIVGVEARKHLAELAETIFEAYSISTVKMVHSDIQDFPISRYSAFYFYNPFEENLVPHLKLDDNLELSFGNYGSCVSYAYSQFSLAKKGSRLVTYHGSNFQVPGSYKLIEEHENGDLKFWIKEE